MLVSCWLYFNSLETVTNNQMPEPILEPKFTELVVFGYTTDFKCQQPKTKTEKNKIGCRNYFSLGDEHPGPDNTLQAKATDFPYVFSVAILYINKI